MLLCMLETVRRWALFVEGVGSGGSDVLCAALYVGSGGESVLFTGGDEGTGQGRFC
jgi:hypothetical protein